MDQQVADHAEVSRSSQESDEDRNKIRSKKPDLASRPDAPRHESSMSTCCSVEETQIHVLEPSLLTSHSDLLK
jgi:hypothetical protein